MGLICGIHIVLVPIESMLCTVVCVLVVARWGTFQFQNCHQVSSCCLCITLSACGSLWFLVVLCGSLWFIVVLGGSLRFLVVPCGFLRFLAVPCSSLQLLAVSCGCLGLLVVPCGSFLVVPCGSLWFLVVPCSSLWLLAVACGSLCVRCGGNKVRKQYHKRLGQGVQGVP